MENPELFFSYTDLNIAILEFDYIFTTIYLKNWIK